MINGAKNFDLPINLSVLYIYFDSPIELFSNNSNTVEFFNKIIFSVVFKIFIRIPTNKI